MKAVIIAGGLGTRLRPLTYNTPKPVVPVANRPFVVHQIEHLVRHGVDEIILNLHYLSHEIRRILNDGREFKMSAGAGKFLKLLVACVSECLRTV